MNLVKDHLYYIALDLLVAIYTFEALQGVWGLGYLFSSISVTANSASPRNLIFTALRAGIDDRAIWRDYIVV